MCKRRNAFSGVLILALLVVFATAAQAETQVFVAADCLDGTKETAAELGKVAKLADLKDSKDTIIVAGRLGNKHIAPLVKKSGLEVDTKWIGEQGFYIKTLKDGKILVTANTKVGVLYGLTRIREELKKRGKSDPFVLKLNLRDRPAFKYRSTGPYANFAQTWQSFGCENFTMEDFPELFKNRDEYKRWVKGSYKRLKVMKALADDAHSRGGKFYMHTRAPIYPYHLSKRKGLNPGFGKQLKKLHPEIFATLTAEEKKQGISRYFCWSSKILRRIVIRNYKRIFAKIPDLDGIILVVHNGKNGYLNCHCEKCSKLTGRQRLEDLLKVLTATMRKYNPKAKIILRDWGLKPLGVTVNSLAKTLPADVEYFTKLTVPPGNDYLWYNHFTPEINTPRLVVWGVNGCHTNDSIPGHMFYMGGKMKIRARKMLAAGVLGIWSGSPKYGCEDLNEIAAAQTAWNPEKFDPLECLKRWASDNFSPEAANHVVKALYESHKITDYLVVDEFCTNSSQVFHWDPKRPSQYGQAVAQSEAVKNVTVKTFDKLRQRYGGFDALERAARMVKELAGAQAILPKNAKLKRMLKWAKATYRLVQASSNYNMALLNYNLYKNTARIHPELAFARLKQAESYITHARRAKDEYVEIYSIISETTSLQGKRYRSFVGEQVENGYDAIMTALSEKKPLLIADGSKSLRSKDWPKIAQDKVWRQGKKLVIPDRLVTNHKKYASSLKISLEADLSRGALLRINSEIRSKSGWRSYRHSNADIYVDGKLIGRIRRNVQGYMLHDHAYFKAATPAKYRWAFVIPPRPGKVHTITIKTVAAPRRKRSFIIRGLELRHRRIQ